MKLIVICVDEVTTGEIIVHFLGFFRWVLVVLDIAAKGFELVLGLFWLGLYVEALLQLGFFLTQV